MLLISHIKNPQRVSEYHGNASASNSRSIAENRAVWTGLGAMALRLNGAILPDPLARIAFGRDPNSGRLLPGLTARSVRRPGYDLCFTPPKSVSVVALVGGDEMVVAAHRQAVEVAFSYLESIVETQSIAGALRRGERTQNLVAAHFVHTHARSGDPHLHSHLIAFNLTLSLEKAAWRAFEPMALYCKGNASLLDQIYLNEMRCLLGDAGYETEKEGNAFAIRGVPKEVCRVFSKGAAAISARVGQIEVGPSISVGRAREWANENVRARRKEFIEGFTVDSDRWRLEAGAESVAAIDSVAACAKRQSSERAPQTMDESRAKEALTGARRHLFAQSFRSLTPRNLAAEALKRCAGAFPWNYWAERIRGMCRTGREIATARFAHGRKDLQFRLLPLQTQPVTTTLGVPPAPRVRSLARPKFSKPTPKRRLLASQQSEEETAVRREELPLKEDSSRDFVAEFPELMLTPETRVSQEDASEQYARIAEYIKQAHQISATAAVNASQLAANSKMAELLIVERRVLTAS
jgi:conjugative relaxase-like TrwC/TraI family protein